jgi:hypothetical protein
MNVEANDLNTHTNSCIWLALEKIKHSQDKAVYLRSTCKLIEAPAFKTIPFILQTQKGEPFFTWAKAGKPNCFATIFFKVVKLDHETGCVILRLLRPNKCVWDDELNGVKFRSICEVDFVTETDEGVTIDPTSFSAIKCFDPTFVQEEEDLI